MFPTTAGEFTCDFESHFERYWAGTTNMQQTKS